MKLLKGGFPHPPQALIVAEPSFSLWHSHSDHPNNRTMKQIKRENSLSSTPSNSSVKCESCLLGKLAKIPLAYVDHKSITTFKFIHSDVWGPSPVLSNVGFKYFVLFVDDFTRFTWIYFLKNKGQVFSMFKEFESLVYHQFNLKIKSVITILIFDNLNGNLMIAKKIIVEHYYSNGRQIIGMN